MHRPMHSKHCLVQMPKQGRHDLQRRADLFRRLAAAVGEGDMSMRLSALATSYQAAADAEPDEG